VTGAVLDRPASAVARPRLDGGITLEERLFAALHEACTNGSTECPVCRARMTSTRAGGAQAGSAPVGESAGADCGGCGSQLS
jgi:hypothetical protein